MIHVDVMDIVGAVVAAFVAGMLPGMWLCYWALKSGGHLKNQ